MKKILALIKEYIRYFFTQLKNRINKTFKSMEGAVVTHSFLSIAASFLVCVIVSSVVLFEIGGDFDSKEKEYQDYSYIDDYTEVDIANFSKEEYDYYLEHHKLETDDLTGSLEIKDLPDRIIDNEEINQPVVLTWDEAIIQLNESIDNSQASIEHPQTLSVMQIGGNEVIADSSIIYML